MASTHSEDHFEGFHDMKSLKTLESLDMRYITAGVEKKEARFRYMV